VGAHAGEPILFIIPDFHFLTNAEIIISPFKGLLHPQMVKELQICFALTRALSMDAGKNSIEWAIIICAQS